MFFWLVSASLIVSDFIVPLSSMICGTGLNIVEFVTWLLAGVPDAKL